MKYVITIYLTLSLSLSIPVRAERIDDAEDRWAASAKQQDIYFRNKLLITQILLINKCSPEESKKSQYHEQLVRDIISIWKMQNRGYCEKTKLYDSIIKTVFTDGCLKHYPMPLNPTEEQVRLVVGTMGVDVSDESKKETYLGFLNYLNSTKNNKEVMRLDFLLPNK